MIQQSYIFGGDTGISEEEIKRRREIANAMMLSNMRAPRNVGEGLHSFGNSIGGAMLARKARLQDENRLAAEGKQREADLNFLGGLPIFGGSGASASIPADTANVAEMDPSDPEYPQARVDQAWGGSKEDFINMIAPDAVKVGERIGVDPRIIIAQAAQETGWGKSAPGNNFFGIKSHGQGGGQNLTTHEVINGKRVKINDNFRTYDSPGQSVHGYGDFIENNPRYEKFRTAKDFDSQVAALGQSGYATDPNYASSVASIARGVKIPNQIAGNLSRDQVMGLMQRAGSSDPNTARIAQALLNQHMQSLQGPDEMERLKLEAQRLNNEKLQTELARGPKREFREIVGPDGIEYLAEYDPQTNTWKPANMPQGGTPAVRPPSQSEAQRKKADEANAQLFDTLTTDGIAANRNLGRVEILEDLLGDTETGLVAEAKRIAGQWGIETEGLDDIQATVALLNTLIPAQRPEGSGTTSDRDMDMYRASLPQLINTEGGNAIIIETMKRLGKYTVEQGKIAQQVQTNKISTEEGFNRLNALPDPFEGFKQWRKQRKAGKEAPAKAEVSKTKAEVSENIKAIGNMSYEALETLDKQNLTEEERAAAEARWDLLEASRANNIKGGRP